MIRLIRIVLGCLALVIGVAGLVLPILQGWLFLAIGALLLAPNVPVFARMLCWVQDRFPRLHRTLDRVRRKQPGDHGGQGPEDQNPLNCR